MHEYSCHNIVFIIPSLWWSTRWFDLLHFCFSLYVSVRVHMHAPASIRSVYIYFLLQFFKILFLFIFGSHKHFWNLSCCWQLFKKTGTSCFHHFLLRWKDNFEINRLWRINSAFLLCIGFIVNVFDLCSFILIAFSLLYNSICKRNDQRYSVFPTLHQKKHGKRQLVTLIIVYVSIHSWRHSCVLIQ